MHIMQYYVYIGAIIWVQFGPPALMLDKQGGNKSESIPAWLMVI